MRTRWRFGLNRRFVATIEWLLLFPNAGAFPQTAQTFDIRTASIARRSDRPGEARPDAARGRIRRRRPSPYPFVLSRAGSLASFASTAPERLEPPPMRWRRREG